MCNVLIISCVLSAEALQGIEAHACYPYIDGLHLFVFTGFLKLSITLRTCLITICCNTILELSGTITCLIGPTACLFIITSRVCTNEHKIILIWNRHETSNHIAIFILLQSTLNHNLISTTNVLILQLPLNSFALIHT